VTFLAALLAFILDKLLGEPRSYHPLVGFGNLTNQVEKKLNQGGNKKLKGVLAVFLLLLPFTLLVIYLERFFQSSQFASIVFAALVLYFAVGWKSLAQHARQVSEPLKQVLQGQENDQKAENLVQARYAVSMIVSRNTAELDETAVAKAATESVLENGADAVFAPLFWFAVLGVPGVLFYRLSNTLDAMWGYKNERFVEFGWCAARLDDVLNFIPARLCALSYALMGKTKQALLCWRTQGLLCESPNAGPVMASGAGALNVSLGGDAKYHGRIHSRPQLGPRVEEGAEEASFNSIDKACRLVNDTLILWLAVLFLFSVVLGVL